MEKHTNPKVAYSVAALIVLALAGGAYAFATTGKNDDSQDVTIAVASATPTATAAATPTPSATAASPSASPLSTATPDPTADWKAYANTKFGYSLKYPGSLTLTYLGMGGEGEGYEKIASDAVITDNKTKTLQVSSMICTADVSFDEAKNTLVSSNKDNTITSQSQGTVDSKKSYSIVVKDGYNLEMCGNTQGGTLNIASEPPVPSPAKITVIPNGKNVYFILQMPSQDTELSSIADSFRLVK